MLSRAARPAITLARTANQQQAGMATLKEIEQRLKSVRNIEKITKSMKVVASTKLTRAEKAMREAKKYGAANNELFKHTETQSEAEPKILYVGISSDGGLCGGIHSSISRYIKKEMIEQPGALAVVGDKPKAQLSRAMPQAFKVSFSAVGKDVPTFGEASAIADEIVKNGGEWDVIKIVSNKYLSAISYEAGITTVISAKALQEAAGFQQYEMEEDVSKDLAEFSLANAIYTALVEGHAAEISARRTAMENASNNALDMMGSLQLQYNRGRQAVITNELIDIITGASAL
ncbi:ATP synthase F1, gamma subunit [Cryptococcus deuterogattii 99/473]|uniref:ATP synthase subunit gamma n=2 Tax=Cryptococcus deuterogattii TaxID=1859096 RepID=A0A0D0UZH6_9TREE|nr:ATP synthase F1 gamma subunit [Cryptococcus deuterogattii R265]KIR29567.1 ATP synthase F1, gamma subunit [Cryptococcus deuterogattii LA55]KIR34469.1 ATP synthase F1, gamma subunit [Cryptococcus deuterogattii MMRL2647]KIR39594.1 ATP synthase F1, gamma subunit [Cryptococcus deuterogattii Ram5]KIR73930.1 ATP synthase F1, gamma subunit [Cryptococcus deuterogattii CA1014]KIR93421.1 ATP synthase F1, gamma subunit [Cryptococcus deuterogattii CBS 10090]KIR99315.1 ATP synthase F1, gamma subunit [Cr